MVLQNIRVSNGAIAPNCENTPPQPMAPRPKGLVSRIYQESSTRRRARDSGSSTRTPKYRADQAKRRRDAKPKSVKFTVTTIPTMADVEMASATASSSSLRPKSYPISLPKELSRPPYKEISLETICAVEPDLSGMELPYIRESLDAVAHELLKALHNVKVNPVKDHLPKELTVMANDMTDLLPTHMLAVFGRSPGPPAAGSAPRPRKVTLFPVHSLVLLANCANLPQPPDTIPTPNMGEAQVNLPVWSLCLPSPLTYPHLSTYLYSKSTDFLLKSLLPTPPPAALMSDAGQARVFALQLAGTFTVQALLRHALTVHGLWQNVCALGVFDDALWDAMDVMWRVLLTALSIATGDPAQMLPSPLETLAS